MKVNILGAKYKIIIATEAEKPKLSDCDGYMDFSVKEIVVGKFAPDHMSVENLKDYTKKVMRHEIIHAFLYESGMDVNAQVIDEGWAVNEEMVDWIAIQSPKILKAFKDANAL